MESKEISFITWPDGKVDGASLTVAGERLAWAQFIQQWLPTDWFGPDALRYSALDSLRDGARKKGFKAWTVTLSVADGALSVEQK